jgi:fatty acid desaturase
MLVCSFAEHKAVHTPFERTAIVEVGPFISLLFLNNNLHFAHHRRLALACPVPPAYYRKNRDQLLEIDGGFLCPGGSGEITRRSLFRPVDQAVHPFV